MFSGFSFAKSVSEGGDLYGIWQISGGSKKIRRFLKKLAIFLKKNKVFFLFDLLFLGEQDYKAAGMEMDEFYFFIVI